MSTNLQGAITEHEAVIGLEIHAQLLTRSKIFCGCSTRFGAVPNTQVCPICTGMPGVLPVMNRSAVEMAIRAGTATNCRISSHSRFARKNYFYPDLPKGYQISQYEQPLCEAGFLEIQANGTTRCIGITRIHMEEDAGKNLHEGISGASHVDLNRAGVPLLEIVSEPDLRSPEEAVAYLKKFRDILVYLGVCDGNMEEGSLRCDANVSLRPKGSAGFGTKTEIKNLNSFRFVQRALEYEIRRQAQALREGGRVVQETRLWDAQKGVTIPMRSKEEAHDYRYFPEPDLVPLEPGPDWVDQIRRELPELPQARRERFVRDYGLTDYDAEVLTSEKAVADYFETCAREYTNYKNLANWILTESLREVNEGRDWMSHSDLVRLLTMVEEGLVNRNTAKKIFEEASRSGKSPEEIVREQGLTQVSDQAALGELIEEVIRANPKEVSAYKAGKDKLLGFFVGQVMKRSGGKANPGKVNELLKERLAKP